MEQLISVIISATLKKVKIPGWSSMMREFGSSMLMILSWNALVENTGGDKVKMPTF